MSIKMRQEPERARNSVIELTGTVCIVGWAKNSSMANKLMPMEPKGTSPSSIRRSDIRSQSSEPMPTPTANAASKAVVISSLPFRISSVYAGICSVMAEPKNQNQEMPSIDRKTLCFSRANLTIRQVSVQTFQLTVSAGSAALVIGIRRLAR